MTVRQDVDRGEIEAEHYVTALQHYDVLGLISRDVHAYLGFRLIECNGKLLGLPLGLVVVQHSHGIQASSRSTGLRCARDSRAVQDLRNRGRRSSHARNEYDK